MSLFFFDIHDGNEFCADDHGIECACLGDVSKQAVDVLPDLARDILPDGPRRTISVRVRDGDGRAVFRASTLASAWIVDEVGDEEQPGDDRWLAALSRTKSQVHALRREFA